MKPLFQMAARNHMEDEKYNLDFLSVKKTEKIRAFHQSFPMYRPTPLAHLPQTAALLGLKDIHVKDESKRFGLNAFKVLGGSYAIGSFLAEKLGMTMDEVSFDFLSGAEARKKLGDITFITATDGNHGRGVAWTATQFGMKSVVYMPKGSALERLNNIIAAGADASITEWNYDDTVRLASKHARENGWVLVQDTSWAGYEEISTRIMQGYCTMGLEAHEQLPEALTHIFLQAGVGAMPGAISGLFPGIYGEKRPIVVIVEPDKADCIYRTAEANNGKLHAVTGNMDTIMAGLAWNVLRNYADYFISCPDYVAARGMRILGNPAGTDDRVVSGESGAAAFGCAAELMTNPELQWMKEKIGLNEESRPLFFSTEGATDRENYRAIVWDGQYPSMR